VGGQGQTTLGSTVAVAYPTTGTSVNWLVYRE
jgi:hypothetical protein